jgi:fucose 4-O-acetylase-like acetyltransferase
VAPTRDPWLDNVKMVLVTLVVVGHAIGLVEATAGSHWVYDFIYMWHIPAFVFVSGYLSKSFEWDRRRMKSLVYTLAIPYLIFEPALFYYRRIVVGEDVTGPLWLEPHWTMWYLIVLLMWRLVTPILKLHWLFLPLSVVVSLLGGLWDTETLMFPRFLGLLPFFVLGLYLKPRHLAHLDDVWVRVAAVPTLIGIGIMAVYTDTWAETALLWYDTGYNELPIDNEIAFQTRLTVMLVGLLGAFAAMSLVPRRSLGWFTTMGTATMVIYLFHGFVIKTFKALGWPDFTAAHPWLGLVLTILGAVGLALLLASPPVRRVLEPFTNPLGWLEARRASRATPEAATPAPAAGPTPGPTAGPTAGAPTSDAPPSAAPSPARAPRDASAPSRPGGPGATGPEPLETAGGGAGPADPPATTSSDDRGPASTP